MNKVGIVILNYLNYKDTVDCVNSLLKDKYPIKEIIIVDNHSENGSKEFLQNYLNTLQEKVYFLENNKNDGFARGNNVGIVFARKKLHCEFLLIVNNDTVFIDENLINKLLAAYEEGIAVIGPRVISKNGYEQNPIGIMSYNDVKKHFKIKSQAKIFLKNIRADRLLDNIRKKYTKIRNDLIKQEIGLDLVLHGSCMFLTPDYFKYYPYLFPETFLYYEENILTLLTHKVGLKKKFITSSKIFHKEDQSSILSFDNDDNIICKYMSESKYIAERLKDLDYVEIIKCFK